MGGKERIYINNINESEEEVLIRSIPTWYIRISDRTKLKCIKELASTKFVPGLDENLKETLEEDLVEDSKTPKIEKTTRTSQQPSLYFNVIESISKYLFCFIYIW